MNLGNDNSNVAIWVIDTAPSATCIERLGDARRLANAMGTHAGVLLIGSDPADARQLAGHGADVVLLARPATGESPEVSLAVKVQTTRDVLQPLRPRVVLAGGDPPGREWAALVAAACDWQLVSPALLVDWRAEKLAVTRLDHTGRRSVRVIVDDQRTGIVTLRPGVGEAWGPEAERTGELREVELSAATDTVVTSQGVPANPAEVDIRHAGRLVAGGRGLGGKAGFDLLREFADHLDAGVAASRMAVDLGWIEFARQVGQTGKTVEPDLYIACGISGASHHLQGMSKAGHIIAINTDPDAPIFKAANLGLAADLYAVLENAKRRLAD